MEEDIKSTRKEGEAISRVGLVWLLSGQPTSKR